MDTQSLGTVGEAATRRMQFMQTKVCEDVLRLFKRNSSSDSRQFNNDTSKVLFGDFPTRVFFFLNPLDGSITLASRILKHFELHLC